jgi:hypothetical protein
MVDTDLYIILGLGGLFLLIGVSSLLWGHREKEDYYKAISSRHDVREYMQQTPEIPEPVGLKIGGILSIIVGLVMLFLGVAFLF